MEKIKNKAALMITLGHGASALFYNGHDKPIGYEQERLDRKKSSSAFPKDAINKIISQIDTKELIGGSILISHWFDNFNLENVLIRRYDAEFINELALKFNMHIISVSPDCTHHDAHMYSSKAFFDDNLGDSDKPKDMHYMVLDGFGNNQEVLSIYKQSDYQIERLDNIELIRRVFGYKNSLGLMYQFATAYCNMKENQDEFKFLGYESHIGDVLESGIEMLDKFIEEQVNIFISNAQEINKGAPANYFLNTDDLNSARDYWYKIFDKIISNLNRATLYYDSKRVIIGYFIQSMIEKICVAYIKQYNIHNVCLSGGCFYNVKLNNTILKAIDGVVSIMPLAGDQGAAIGMYKKYVGNFKFYDLCYGKRDYKMRTRFKYEFDGVLRTLRFNDNRHDFEAMVVMLINAGNIVNIVTGSMEFGPRALCNTSTLALPTSENVAYINNMNGRNTVMPMAPVILEKNFYHLFKDEPHMSRVIGSNKFMITTYDYRDDIDFKGYAGVTCGYPNNSKLFSGRPQVIYNDSKSPIKNILNHVCSECLINTSFNVHGNPILYTLNSVLVDFKRQCKLDHDNKNYLIIYEGE